MSRIILYTSTRCPKCPLARKVVREVCKEIGWVEGKDFIEKLVDGKSLAPGPIVLEGDSFNIVRYPEQITPELTPAIVGCDDYSLEALMHQVASTPSIVIDGVVRFVSKVPTREELLKALGR
ncbi:MAG: thioredoxin family protein [Nanoarchaeota archaeon]|nr:thioredoxin family protein [Nanoarchaeota archaeon]MBU4072458.1 thioredoxin family protein [Candidatus Thermoplasmatota archaeon]